ncbi:Peptidyl-prolyl cis-trans isomerase A [Sigmodon hispidus]
MVNPTMFFDITADGRPLGLISFKLFADEIPKTIENFHTLRTREKESGYEGSSCHRIIPGLICQGGDFICHDGTGNRFICGEKLEDQIFILKSSGPGIFYMADSGPNTRGSLVLVLVLSVPPRLSGWMADMWSWEDEIRQEHRGSHGAFWSRNGKASKITLADSG